MRDWEQEVAEILWLFETKQLTSEEASEEVMQIMKEMRESLGLPV